MSIQVQMVIAGASVLACLCLLGSAAKWRRKRKARENDDLAEVEAILYQMNLADKHRRNRHGRYKTPIYGRFPAPQNLYED